MSAFQIELEKIRELHRSGHLDEAKQAYLRILKKNPRHVETLHALGIISAQQENFTDSIDYLETALKYDANNLSISLHLANILKIQGLFSKAAEILENVVHHNPDYVPAFNNLGSVYYSQGKLNEAVRFYRHAIQKQPDYVDAYYNLALAQSKQNNFSDAILSYKKLLDMAPEHFAARFHLGALLMQTENLDAAIENFLIIETAQPYHFETQTNLATCYLKQGKLNEAKNHYLKALELHPNDLQIQFNLGVINMQQGQIDNAIQFYQLVLQTNPDYFPAHNNLGVAFLAKQHANFALHHFQEALRLQPNNEAIRYTVAMLSKHQHLLAAPKDYVKSLFDAYADHYEPHLLTALDYRVPELLSRAVNATKVFHEGVILDLGCGTGLCGIPFKPFATKLIGVDLSEKMLARAAEKNIYDELVASDLNDYLREKNASFDLIIAGDVLVYVGDLAEIFSLVRLALKNNGLFVFNAEIENDAEFKMNQSGRFSHQKLYLETLAEKNNFKILSYETAETRKQNNEPVLGHVYVMQKIN